jgi:hypothetical protein
MSKTVAIHDSRSVNGTDYLAFDLHDVLTALGEPVRLYTWLVSGFEGSGDEEIEPVADESRRGGHAASGDELLEFSKRVVQTSKGEFVAVEPSFERPRAVLDRWIARKDFASSEAFIALAAEPGRWVVSVKADGLVEALRKRFKDLRDV